MTDTRLDTSAIGPTGTTEPDTDAAPGVTPARSRHRAAGRRGRITTGPVRRGALAGMLGPVTVALVVVWEVAALAAAVAWPHAGPTRVVVLVLAVLLVIVTTVRLNGLRIYRWLGVLVRFRLRTRRTSASGTDALTAAVPDLVLRAHYDRAGNHVGLANLRQRRWVDRPGGRVGAGTGWAGVVRVSGSGGTDAVRLADVLTAAFTDSDLGLAAGQLVSWTVPGPADGPPLATHWLALRYEPAANPVAARARGGGVEGAQRTAAVAVLGLARDLIEAGYVCSVLDEDELRQELTVALGADVGGLAAAPPTVSETWRTWSVGRLQQTVHRPRRFARALARFGAPVPGAEFSCWSLTVRRDRLGRLRRELSLRVGAEAPVQVPPVLVPLVGRQAAFVRSTLPLAAD